MSHFATDLLVPASARRGVWNFSWMVACLAVVGLLTGGCQSVQLDRGPETTIRVAEIGNAPAVYVYADEVKSAEATRAIIADVLRKDGFTVTPEEAARYEVRGLWRVVSRAARAGGPTDADDLYDMRTPGVVRQGVLDLRIVDRTNDDRVVYKGSSWPVDLEILGPPEVRQAVEVALKGLR